MAIGRSSGVYDEMSSRRRAAAPALRGVRPVARGDWAARARVAMGGRQARDSRERRHLQRLRRSAGRRSAVGRSTWCRCSSRRRNGAGSRAALMQRTRLLNLILADLYGPQTAAARRPAAAGARAREPGVPAAVSWHARPARHLPAPACRRSGALAGRSVVGAGRSHAGAVGRRVCAREPHRAVAQPARGVPRLSGAAAGVVLSRAARRA